MRVGTEIGIDGVAVINESGDAGKFAAAVQAASEKTNRKVDKPEKKAAGQTAKASV